MIRINSEWKFHRVVKGKTAGGGSSGSLVLGFLGSSVCPLLPNLDPNLGLSVAGLRSCICLPIFALHNVHAFITFAVPCIF